MFVYSWVCLVNCSLAPVISRSIIICLLLDYIPFKIASSFTYKKIDGLMECHSRIFQPSVLISFIGLLGIIYKIAVQLLSLVGPKSKFQYLNSKALVSYLRSPKLYTKNLFIVFFFKQNIFKTMLKLYRKINVYLMIFILYSLLVKRWKAFECIRPTRTLRERIIRLRSVLSSI